MADIRLKDYVAKIKDLIRSVRLDEAIAHCQHILRYYPKHVETYSLLGEACLEKQMYREAIEFFQRTLGADPENLTARVGLGVIYDEQGAFPEAIWQLERAFELVPGNSEVRRELLRLYGQFDGIDKSRLKLTRGALGRLYSRNGLYERAIGEFHAVLRQDPELPDIRIALVEALWREGRQVEAVEICLELLDALPNCLKANLILGEIWLRGGNTESAEQRLSVARALDPENRVAQDLMGSDSPLPPEDVLIPALDAIPDEFAFALSEVPGTGVVEPADAADLVAESAPDEEELAPWGTDEELPDWLRDVGVTAEEPVLELAPDETPIEPPPDEALPAEDMPDWLREVMAEGGGQPIAEPVIDEGEDFEGESVVAGEAAESLEETDTGDLVGAGLVIAGLMDDEEEEPAGADAPGEEMPEWLEMLVGDAGRSESEEVVPDGESAAAAVAEFEEDIASRQDEPLTDQDAPAGIDLAGDTPDEAPSEAPDEAPGGAPEWVGALKAAGAAGVAGAAGLAALALTGDEEEAPPDADAPELAPDQADDLAAALDTVAVEESDELPTVDLEGEPGAIEQDLLSDEDLPDWLRDLGVTEVAEDGEPGVAELPDAEIETDVLPVPLVAELEGEPEPDKEVVAGEALAGEVAEGAPEGAPDWLHELDDLEMEDAAGPVVAEVVGEPAPDEAPEGVAEGAPEGVPDWLRELDDLEMEDAAGPVVAEVAGEPEPDEAPEGVAEGAPEGIPDWLRALGQPEEKVAQVEEPAAVEEEVPLIDEIPDWLRDLDKLEVEEISASPVTGDEPQAVAEEGGEGAVPESLLALVAAGLLDESDLESAMAEMSDEDLASQRAEDIPEWLSELVEEDAPAAAEAEPAAGEPPLQEIPTPVLEMVDIPGVEELYVEEVVVEAEPEVAAPVEEVVSEVVEAEPEPEVAALVEAIEPEPEAEVAAPVEEVVVEVVEPEPEAEVAAPVEEVVVEPEPEPEVAAPVEEVVAEVVEAIEPEPEAEVAAPVEEVVSEVVEAEPEPEVAAPVEEVVVEPEPEPEVAAPIEEVVVEPEPEVAAPVEEAVVEAIEPEPEPGVAAPVEEVVAEVIEAEPEVAAPIEEAVAEVIDMEEEIAAPVREDELLQQLKARPRDYASRLELARLYYDEQDWDAALTNYEKLISARRFLPDIVADLEPLAEQDVEPARVYQMLGDAYMQQDQLDQALEMYRRARRSLTKR